MTDKYEIQWIPRQRDDGCIDYFGRIVLKEEKEMSPYKHRMTETDMTDTPWAGYDMLTSEKDIDLFGLHAESDEEAQRDAEFWRKANRNTVIGLVILLFVLVACGAGIAEWVS